MGRFPSNSIIVRYDEVMIDDVILGYTSVADAKGPPPTAEYAEKHGQTMGRYLATSISDGYLFGRPISGGCLGTKTAIFILSDRSGYAIVTRGPKFTPQYPHTCPRCGRSAYVGLVKVEHEDASRVCL